MNRYVLLDFDGVICNASSYTRLTESCEAHDGGLLFDPACVARVQHICEATDAVVVLSTSWRCAHDLDTLRGWLRERGLSVAVVGATPWKPDAGRWRHEEIADWLAATGTDPAQIVILDDEPIPPPLACRHVASSFHGGGLTDEHVDRAIALFAVAA